MLIGTLALLLSCNRPPSPTLDPISEDAALTADRRTLTDALRRLPSPTPRSAPSVVIVVLDTFRADRLTDYGAPAVLAPHLEAFADDARVYTQMRSTSSWTLPSHASLFTAQYPIQHGAHGTPAVSEGVGYAMRREAPTLAERLQIAGGYRSVGIAANRGFLGGEWGLQRGFDVWLCEDLAADWNGTYPQAERITALALSAQETLATRGEPYLLFLNYMDPHTPWIPRTGYTDAPEQIVPRLLPQVPAWRNQKSRWHRIRRQVLSQKRPARPKELATWKTAYDAEVRYLDEHIGALLSGLAAQGHGPEDYTIILSDHGEYLGEHDLLNHSKGLHEEVIRVPLLIRGPGFSPGADPQPVQTRDVPELLLDALSFPRLQPGLDDGALQVAELYWARHRDLEDPLLVERFNHVQRAFIQNEQKIVIGDNGDFQAYDLTTDPQEQHPRPHTDWARASLQQHQGWASQQSAADAVRPPVDEERLEQLRKLGYVE